MCTGVKQGDPLSTLFFTVAIQAARDEIDEDIMDLHPGSDTARAGAFADDGVVVWDALQLVGRFPHYAARIHALTNLHVQMSKNVLMVSGVATPAVMREAGRLGLKVVAEGAVVLGASVGTDQFIADDINTRVLQLTHDLAAVAHFTAHDKHTLFRMCVDQRPVYLQRLLGLAQGSEAFQGFDDAVTEALLDTMKVVLPAERIAVRDQVHSLRGLVHLSGSNVRHLGRATTSVRALLLCRDNIVRFLCALLRVQWQMEQLLPQTDISPAAGYDPTTDADTGSLGRARWPHTW